MIGMAKKGETRLLPKERHAMKEDIIRRIEEAKLCAIVRGLPVKHVRPVAEALLSGGVRVIEVTFDTPGAKDMIEIIKRDYGDRMLVGAGTVLDTETARTAILSGADFLLAPTLNTAVIELCNRYSKLAVPGVMTPTEILTALEAGAGIVKVFPAGALGPGYIKDVLGPLKQARIMAVGGVSLENCDKFLQAGACSVGIGSQLVGKKLVDAGDYAAIRALAGRFVEKLKA